MVKKAECIAIILLGFLVIFGITVGTGTLTSGWHFVDDHELFRISNDFSRNGNVLKVLNEWVFYDFRWRFRPLYYVERVLGTYFFGTNLLYWNLFKSLEGVATVVLLYWTARNLHCNYLYAGFFALIIMIGQQFAPWFRAANQENTGMLLCAIAMFLITRQYKKKEYNHRKRNLIISLFCVFCSLMKESFTLYLPAFIMLKLGLEYLDKDVSIMKMIKEQALFIGITLATLLFNLVCIIFFIGTDKVGYGGIHYDEPVSLYINGIVASLQGSLKWYLIFGVFFLILLAIYVVLGFKNLKKHERRLVLLMMCIGLYVLASQMVLYAKSQMMERYLLPWIIGYAFVFVICVAVMLDADLVDGRKNVMFKYTYLFLLSGLLLLESGKCLFDKQGAIAYAENGIAINQMLNDVLKNTQEDDNILLATDYETDFSGCVWLENHERKNGYIYSSEDKNYYDGYGETNRYPYSETEKFIDGKDVDMILTYASYYHNEGWLNKLLKNLSTDMKDYEISLYGGKGYCVLYKTK